MSESGVDSIYLPQVVENLLESPWFNKASPVDQYITAKEALEIFFDKARSSQEKQALWDVLAATDPAKKINKVAKDISEARDPSAGTAIDHMIGNPDFQHLSPIVRVKILFEAQRASGAGITNLTELAGRPDFQNALPEKQSELIEQAAGPTLFSGPYR
jgi:hypothetical protein